MYDLIIIGGGPAGMTAAIYALRGRLKVLLLEKLGLGGQVAKTDILENYPGFLRISGMDLSGKLVEQVEKLGLSVKYEEVKEVKPDGENKIVITDSNTYATKTVIIATGANPRHLGIKGEQEFSGKGVSYCATCDGFFFRDREIAVVGGGDTAVKEALYLADIVKKVNLIHRRDSLRAEKILQERLLSHPKVNFYWDSVAEEITGEQEVSRIKIRNIKTQESQNIAVEGVFIFIGILPHNDFISAEKDELGFLKTNDKLETSLSGVYAVGDCRVTLLRQVTTAVGDGALAASVAAEYIKHRG